jgi:hypothetical protein
MPHSGLTQMPPVQVWPAGHEAALHMQVPDTQSGAVPVQAGVHCPIATQVLETGSQVLPAEHEVAEHSQRQEL